MTDRRAFLTASLTTLATSLLADATGAAPPTSKVVVQRDTPAVNLEGWQLTATEVTYGPGESAGRHRHPGFVCGYVLEGRYRFAVDGQPERTLSTGEMFFEQPGDVHAVSGNASDAQPTRILALVFTKKGDPVTIPGGA